MRQDIDLIRNIMVTIEHLQNTIEPLNGKDIYENLLNNGQVAASDDDFHKLLYHVKLLEQDYLIEGNTDHIHAGFFMVNSITPSGHRFLDAVTEKPFFQKVKDYLQQNSLPITIASIQTAAGALIANIGKI